MKIPRLLRGVFPRMTGRENVFLSLLVYDAIYIATAALAIGALVAAFPDQSASCSRTLSPLFCETTYNNDRTLMIGLAGSSLLLPGILLLPTTLAGIVIGPWRWIWRRSKVAGILLVAGALVTVNVTLLKNSVGLVRTILANVPRYDVNYATAGFFLALPDSVLLLCVNLLVCGFVALFLWLFCPSRSKLYFAQTSLQISGLQLAGVACIVAGHLLARVQGPATGILGVLVSIAGVIVFSVMSLVALVVFVAALGGTVSFGEPPSPAPAPAYYRGRSYTSQEAADAAQRSDEAIQRWEEDHPR